MQDRKGLDPGYLVPGTWYLAPVPNSHASNLNKALPWRAPRTFSKRRSILPCYSSLVTSSLYPVRYRPTLGADPHELGQREV
jgi:hypothetical protein